MTSDRYQLQANPRLVMGKKTKQLRAQGALPANVYGQGKPSQGVQIDAKSFLKVFSEAGETGLIDLKIEGEAGARPVLVNNVALHPITSNILHVDFYEVNLKEKVKAMIPVEVVGESEAVKTGGVLVLAYNELEVEALPTDLPDSFEIDISALKAVGDDLKIETLSYDRATVEILGVDQDEVLVTIQAPKEEVVEVAAEPVEVEILKGATTEEGKAVQSGTASAEPSEKKE